jgi:hypothetical protein
MIKRTLCSVLAQIRNASIGERSISDAITCKNWTRKSSPCKRWMYCMAGMWLALTAWCPTGHAQTSNQAPASAEEVKQLREVVQSLLTRVTDLESQLKLQQASTAGSINRGDFVAMDAKAPVMATATISPVTVNSVGEEAATNSSASRPTPNTSLEGAKEQASTGEQSNPGFLHGATLNFLVDEYYA